MSKLPRRIVKQVKEEAESEGKKIEKTRFDKVVSTGSTLLDLAISGTRIRGGGIPGGILVEISGMPGMGKTALLSKIGASAQAKGGFFKFADAERRLDLEYIENYGVEITEDNYETPESVSDVIDLIFKSPESEGDEIDVIGVDSIASLISQEEAKEQGDKRGQAKAKELHQLMRKSKKILADKRRLVVFTNQLIDTTLKVGPKTKTPGGYAIPFWSSLRIKMVPPSKNFKVKKLRTIRGVQHEKIVGIRIEPDIFKSTIDNPFRPSFMYIMFGKGIDDVRANLEFLRRASKTEEYMVSGHSVAKNLPEAVKAIEEDHMQDELREEVIDLWEEIQRAFED